MKLTEFLNNLMVQEILEDSDIGDYLKHYRHKRRFREYIFWTIVHARRDFMSAQSQLIDRSS